MIKAVLKRIPNKILISFAVVALILLMPVFFYTEILFLYRDKVIPRVFVANNEISGFKKYQTEELFATKITTPEKIELRSGTEVFNIPTSEIKFSYDHLATHETAYNNFRNDNYYPTALKILASFKKPIVLKPVYTYDKGVLEEYISVVSSKLSVDPVYPSIDFVNNKPQVIRGASGKSVDIQKLKNDIEHSFATNNFQKIEITVTTIDPTLNAQQEENFLKRATSLTGKSLTLIADENRDNLDTKRLVGFLHPKQGYDKEKISIFADEYKKQVEVEPQNSVFTFKDGRVQEFVPSKDGVIVKKDELIEKISNALFELENGQSNVEIVVPVTKSSPEITNSQVNDLGINELLGKGESFFKGSIPGRIHNVGLAASRISGVLVKPGEIFSFNSSVGDVSTLTGYKQAYIIQDGKTILGDGGGVCQVSTTLFRSVLSAGLPIVERAPHSYRVGYYEQNSGPGLDATVYSPTTDFKFKNDTPANILVQSIFDPKLLKLVIEIYGTGDGRASSVSKPVITSSSPPPEDLYIDDPTLPTGTVKQIDYKAWGARVVFDYTVIRNGETIQQKKFVSNYKPWQAKFLKGTAPN